MDEELTEATLAEIEARASGASPAPFTSFVEDRDHTSGDSFLRVSASIGVARRAAGSLAWPDRS